MLISSVIYIAIGTVSAAIIITTKSQLMLHDVTAKFLSVGIVSEHN